MSLISRLRPFIVTPPLALAGLVLVPFQALALKLRLPVSARIPMYFHRMALRTLGVKVTVLGKPADTRPLLLLPNHASWLDILVLGSVMPMAFVAKAEVRGWPVFGALARLQRTVFIERERRAKAGEQAGAIAERLAAGEPMVIFPEGTTSDGNFVLPFRSALIGAAQSAGGEGAAVQPVAIAYTRLQGLPLGRAWRPTVAWVGDEELPGHLMTLLREGAVDVTVAFGEPLVPGRDGDRKVIAAKAETAVRRMLSSAILGR